MPVVCDPSNFDKALNFTGCLEALQTYSDRLGLETPAVDLLDECAKLPFSVASAKSYGLYTNDDEPRVFVNVELSKKPAREPVRVWTFTGWKTDLTAAGILAHEFGHYYDDMFDVCRGHRLTIKALWLEEGCVSSYCPIMREWWAETFRVWFLNPNLLELAKPKTAEFVLSAGFPKSHDLTWQEVLVHAHPRWHAAAENFIKNGRKQNRPKQRKKKA